MALLLGSVDTDTIWLIGRWRSDKILWYLHTSACQLMQNHVHTMATHGSCMFFQVQPVMDKTLAIES
eukprot:8726935-Ditylum_brightwellii.AAC.1